MRRESAGLEIIVAGCGIIGLSLALELRYRGHKVTIVDIMKGMRQASWAAAGMLAVDDPHNPAELLPLSQLSVELYPEFLKRVEALSGDEVPIQTETVVEYPADGRVVRRPERSIDPRQLAVALLAAVRQCGVAIKEDVGALESTVSREGVKLCTASGQNLRADCLVHASGAWFEGRSLVRPRKGQMLRVQMAETMQIAEVHRRADVYIVPRTHGPQAGTALIGATVEEAGFDVSTHAVDLEGLRRLAAALVPVFGDAAQTPTVEAWAGLRPCTPDELPLIGAMDGGQREFVATGHFRNGILLAPGTAVVVADLIERKTKRIDLARYGPERFREL